MQSLPVVDAGPTHALSGDRRPREVPERAKNRRLPTWLRRPLPRANGNFFTQDLLRELRLETVCENARCPNRPECYARRTATFMILGNICTRPCGFCAVERGRPEPLEADEPERVAVAAERLGLRHVVITSVTRDDLSDGGADHFYRCILAVRERTRAAVEVLTPDFLGNRASLERVLLAQPDVYNHNMETVPRLYHKQRGRADYQRSLDLLRVREAAAPAITTKSGLMLGIGETVEELFDAGGPSFRRLRYVAPWPILGAHTETRAGCPLRTARGVRRAGTTSPKSRLPPRRERAVCSFELPRR